MQLLSITSFHCAPLRRVWNLPPPGSSRKKKEATTNPVFFFKAEQTHLISDVSSSWSSWQPSVRFTLLWAGTMPWAQTATFSCLFDLRSPLLALSWLVGHLSRNACGITYVWACASHKVCTFHLFNTLLIKLRLLTKAEVLVSAAQTNILELYLLYGQT